MTKEDVAVLSDMLACVRAHGYVVQRVSVHGVADIDLAVAPPDQLTPGERRALAEPDDASYGARGRKALRF